MGRDAALSFSLANLVLLRVWGRVVFYGGADAFHMKQAPGTMPVVAAALNMALLAALFWALLRLARSPRMWVALAGRLGLLAGGVAALNSIRAIVFGRFPRLRGAVMSTVEASSQAAGGWGAVILAALGLASVLLFLFRGRVRRLGGVGLLCLSPLAPLMLVGAAGRLVGVPQAAMEERAREVRDPVRESSRRAVWVIFDEWDYLRAFESRPGDLRTPHLDRMAQRSLSASQAYSPATSTVRSVASLLEGERLLSAEPAGPSELLIRRSGRPQPAERWSAATTVLARARHEGLNTAVAGWYLPYCRLLAPVVNDCFWCEMFRADALGEAAGTPLPRAMTAQLRSLVETAQHSVLGPSQILKGHQRSYRELLEAGLRFAADPQLGFVFLHLPVPHAPYLVRNAAGELVQGDYAGSLALVDETVGRIEDAMRLSGVWNSTHLLLSADHSLRGVKPQDRRVPFLLRLAGEERERRYDNHLETVASAELLLAALRGEVADHEAAARWLDARQRELSR